MNFDKIDESISNLEAMLQELATCSGRNYLVSVQMKFHHSWEGGYMQYAFQARMISLSPELDLAGLMELMGPTWAPDGDTIVTQILGSENQLSFLIGQDQHELEKLFQNYEKTRNFNLNTSRCFAWKVRQRLEQIMGDLKLG